MSQQDQHLTTEQLSTFLDQQLTSEEQAGCSAHLRDCEQCQNALDNLQQTVNLLRSLPQLEVPRSFTLSADFKLTSKGNTQPQFAQSTARTPRSLPTPLRRTLRTISALAAIIGLFLALASFTAIVSQPHADVTSADRTSLSQAQPVFTQAPSSKASGQPPALPTETNPTVPAPTETNPTAIAPTQPLFAFNLPEIYLSLGIMLTILGSIGFIFFAQRLKPRTHAVNKQPS